MSDLLTCPFCGSEASERTVGDYFQIGCPNYACLAYIIDMPVYLSRQEAVNDWNTRAKRMCHFDQTDEIPTIRGMIRVWKCSNCGRECEELNGVYGCCPHCKAKVMHSANVCKWFEEGMVNTDANN